MTYEYQKNELCLERRFTMKGQPARTIIELGPIPEDIPTKLPRPATRLIEIGRNAQLKDGVNGRLEAVIGEDPTYRTAGDASKRPDFSWVKTLTEIDSIVERVIPRAWDKEMHEERYGELSAALFYALPTEKNDVQLLEPSPKGSKHGRSAWVSTYESKMEIRKDSLAWWDAPVHMVLDVRRPNSVLFWGPNGETITLEPDEVDTPHCLWDPGDEPWL